MDLSSPSSAISEITTIGAAILVNLGVLYTAWRKFKAELHQKTEEIKTHTDITVQKLNGMLSYVIHSFDRPCWIKVASEERGETVFRMLEVNQAYHDAFGIPRANYIGRTDLEAGWTHETAEAFHRNDLVVWATGEPTTFLENVNGQTLRIRKLRLQTMDGKLKGILGYTVDCADPEHCPVYGGTSGAAEI